MFVKKVINIIDDKRAYLYNYGKNVRKSALIKKNYVKTNYRFYL